MKYIVPLFFCLALLASCAPPRTATSAVAAPIPVQVLSDKEWDSLYVALLQSNWTLSNNLAEQYLKRYENAEETGDQARLRYLYIYSLAGLISDKTTDAGTGLNKAKNWEGKLVELPGNVLLPQHDCKFNCLWMNGDDSQTLVSAASNIDGTYIHAYQTFFLKEPLDIKANKGKTLYIGGILSKIELRGQTHPAFAMEVKDCYIIIK